MGWGQFDPNVIDELPLVKFIKREAANAVDGAAHFIGKAGSAIMEGAASVGNVIADAVPSRDSFSFSPSESPVQAPEKLGRSGQAMNLASPEFETGCLVAPSTPCLVQGTYRGI